MMIQVTVATAGYTVGNQYAMMGACWTEDFTAQLDWHLVDDNGVLNKVPFANAEPVS